MSGVIGQSGVDTSQLVQGQNNTNILLAQLIQTIKGISATVGVPGSGVGINAGTIFVSNQATIAATTTATAITPAEGVSDFLVNLGTVNTTIDIGTATHAGQEFWVDIKMGPTITVPTLGTSVTFGTTYPSFTMTNTAAARDRLHFTSVNPSVWALDALAQGFTI
jgi:hypothetical protein